MASVASTISDAQAFATDIANTVTQLLETTGNYVSSLSYSSLPVVSYNYTYTPPTYTDDLTSPDVTVSGFSLPTSSLPTVSFESLPSITTDFAYPDTPVIDTSGLFTAQVPNTSIDSLSIAAPTLDIQALRDYLSAIATPSINSVVSPALQTVTIPTIPTLHLPEFFHTALETVPSITGDARTVFTDAYNDKSSVMVSMVNDQVRQWLDSYAPGYLDNITTLQTKLNTDMTSGNAFSTDYEDALYRRSKSKIMLEQMRVEEDLDKQHAKRGFHVPPGSLIAGRNQLHQATANNLAINATEIAIKRAELEVQHIQFVMQLASTTELGLQNIAINYAGLTIQACSHALDYAKTCSAMFLEMLKLGFERYNLLMQKYQIEANVYETLLKSAMAELEIYKLQLEAAKAVKDIEALDVTVYTKRIESEQIKINQYTALVEAVVKRAEFERLSLDLYSESVKAYVAQVQGKVAEFGIYESAIKADATKLQGELAKIDVVKSQLEAIKLQADIENIQVQAISGYNANLSNQYALELKKYETEIAANKTLVDSGINIKELALKAYSTDLNANLNKYQTDIAAVKPYLEYELAKINDKTTRDVADANRTLGFIKAQTEINGILASSSTEMAKAALGAQTTITSDLISQVTNI